MTFARLAGILRPRSTIPRAPMWDKVALSQWSGELDEVGEDGDLSADALAPF